MKKVVFIMILALSFVSASISSAEDRAEDAAKTGGEAVRLGEVVVTGTRYEEEADRVAANVTLVSPEEIERSTALSVPELLSEYTGINYDNITGSRRGDYLDIRGFGETGPMNNLVLVDGRRVNEVDLSGVDWTQIPLDRVERIEVVRGAKGATIYGDQAVGGVVNIITKKGEGRPRLAAHASYGSHNTSRKWVSLDGGWGGSRVAGDYFLSTSHDHTEGHRKNSGWHQRAAGGNLGFFVMDTFFLEVSGGLKDDTYGLPGGLNREELSRVGRDGSVDYPNHASTEEIYSQVTPGLDLGSFGTLKCGLSYKKKGTNFHGRFPRSGPFSPEYVWINDIRIETLGASPQYILEVDIFGHADTLTLGGDFYVWDHDSEGLFLQSGWGQVTETWIDKYSRAGYVENSFDILDDLTVTAGGRYERVKYDFLTHYHGLHGFGNANVFVPSPPSSAVHEEESFFTGLNWRYLPGSHAYVSYARSFRTPRTDEMFNFTTNAVDPYLLPQHSTHYEAGIEHNFWGYASASLTGFIIETENEIFFDPYQPTTVSLFGTFFGSNVNYDHTERRGTELSVELTPLKDRFQPDFDLALRGSWTHINAEFRGNQGVFRNTGLPKQNYDGLAVPGVPRDTLNFGVDLRLFNYVYVDVSGKWVDTRTILADWRHDLAPLDSYTLVNARFALKARGVEIFVAGNNVFGEEYMLTGITDRRLNPDFYPAPRATVMAGITLSTEVLDYLWPRD